ncbi:MAG TPA: 3-oxoadipate enol-lactonase [Alphaproteobacteria bacterium]|nr:3-oxoadipate enol-lactonase [Alphaproteobacteria bacterium]
MPTVPIEGGHLYYEVAGDAEAPPLLLSHSLGTGLAMWEPQMAAFAARYRVIRYDMRGHGKSSAPAGDYSMAMLAKDALALMDALGIERTYWCGLSMGGMIGLWLATHAPQRLRRAVLANTAAISPTVEMWNARIATVMSQGTAALLAGAIDRWFTKEFQTAHPDIVKRTSALLLATPPQGYAGACVANRDMDQREAIRAIAVPCLVIVGEKDFAAAPEFGRDIHARIAGSKLVSLDAAHLSNTEAPEAFTRAVLDFLAA